MRETVPPTTMETCVVPPTLRHHPRSPGPLINTTSGVNSTEEPEPSPKPSPEPSPEPSPDPSRGETLLLEHDILSIPILLPLNKAAQSTEA